MKKNVRKLALNKKSVSDLSQTIKGGVRTTDDPTKTVDDPIKTIKTQTDPTALTMCYICPPDEL